MVGHFFQSTGIATYQRQFVHQHLNSYISQLFVKGRNYTEGGNDIKLFQLFFLQISGKDDSVP